MASMNVSVPEILRDWVESRIENGEYTSVSDYIRDLIRRDQDARVRQLKVDDIRRSIEESRAEGRTLPADKVFDRIEEKLRRMTE